VVVLPPLDNGSASFGIGKGGGGGVNVGIFTLIFFVDVDGGGLGLAPNLSNNSLIKISPISASNMFCDSNSRIFISDKYRAKFAQFQTWFVGAVSQ
jgi:hypothetical protein